jgi:hypothetical protein
MTTNPVLDTQAFLIYLGVLAAAGCVAAAAMRLAWAVEKGRLRRVILGHLGLPATRAGIAQARERVLAVVPCRGRSFTGSFAGLPRGRLWLCFLRGNLLLISGGDVTVLPGAAVNHLALTERPLELPERPPPSFDRLNFPGLPPALLRPPPPRPREKPKPRQETGLILRTAAGSCTVSFGRVADLVRGVNVFIAQGTALAAETVSEEWRP